VRPSAARLAPAAPAPPSPPGWLDDQPARVTSRHEIRPAAELGPIILCLDTSGSMRGARETVAKALALECLRGAHRQRRKCYLYAFSGPSEWRRGGTSPRSCGPGAAWGRAAGPPASSRNLTPPCAADEVQELELGVELRSLDSLLAFLSCSFMGGTDVDAPLKLSLEKLAAVRP
jgi:hypothetical protein